MLIKCSSDTQNYDIRRFLHIASCLLAVKQTHLIHCRLKLSVKLIRTFLQLLAVAWLLENDRNYSMGRALPEAQSLW